MSLSFKVCIIKIFLGENELNVYFKLLKIHCCITLSLICNFKYIKASILHNNLIQTEHKIFKYQFLLKKNIITHYSHGQLRYLYKIRVYKMALLKQKFNTNLTCHAHNFINIIILIYVQLIG